MAAIDVRNIVKKFGDFTAVKGITFAVEDGEIFGLLGPNGAGKSTLIRMLTTLLTPTSGTAIVNGFDIARQADGVRQSIGVIPQAMTSDLELSVEENLLIFAKLYGVPRDKRTRLIHELLESVELSQWADKQVKNLSGGMRRRVEIARGLVNEPRIFFLDEPTTGLDPVSRVSVWEMLQRIKAHRDLTILLTTHYMDEADKLCDRIAIVDHGELKALDSPMKLKASIPGKNVLEVSFAATPDGWVNRLQALPDVESVTGEDHVFRLASRNGPATTMALMETAAAAGVTLQSLSVQSTSLDDVFVHYTGRALRDALQEANPLDRGFMVRESRAAKSRICTARTHASHLGHHRTRAAPVPPQPHPHRCLDDLSDHPARCPRLCVRRQRQAPQSGRRRSGPRRARSEDPGAVQRRCVRRPYVRY